MKTYQNFVFYFIAFFIFSFQAISQDLTTDFDKIMNEAFDEDGPGATVLVAKDGAIIYHKAFGKANLELDIDMKTAHIFRIGSITKQFTACAILRLMEKGKLALDDEITKYLPDYPTHGKKITIEHLLTHTSGIKSYTRLEKWDAEVRKQKFKPNEMIDFFKDEPMDFDPGEKFLYNNSAYFLLGYIIELVAGQTYEAFIEEEFFGPLKMDHSYYGGSSSIIPDRIPGYSLLKGKYVNAAYLSMSQPYAAGSLLSNVEDLNTWYQAVMNYEVISKETLTKAHTPYTLIDGTSTSYGYGWGMGEIQGQATIQHGGGINGFRTSSIYLPEDKIFVGVFSNCRCNPPGPVAKKIAAIAIGKPSK